jgi:hypothetical protein
MTTSLVDDAKHDTIPAPPPLCTRLHDALDEVLEEHAAGGNVGELAALEGAFVALLSSHRILARRGGAA